jgi:enoyl-CoA hydratase/carnithine racemase
MSDHILTERAGESRRHSTIIRFNRPEKKNAITRDDVCRDGQVRSAMEIADDSVRVHVMLGTPGAFSSGNDMQDFMAVRDGRIEGHGGA